MPKQSNQKEKMMGIASIMIGVVVLAFFVLILIKREATIIYEVPRFMILSENAQTLSSEEGAFAEFELTEEATATDLDGVLFEESIKYYRENLPKNGWVAEIDRRSSLSNFHQFYFRNSNNGAVITINNSSRQDIIKTRVTINISKYDPGLFPSNSDDFELIIDNPEDAEKAFGTPPPRP